MRQYLTLGRWKELILIVSSVVLLCGCGTIKGIFSDSKSQPQVNYTPMNTNAIPVKAGDRIRVDMAVPGTMTIPSRDEQVKEDGTINVDLLGQIRVEGKTPRELEQEIGNLYVAKKLYKSITVTVTPLDRYYYVGGQVTRPGEQHYNGSITVTKAIQSASDFTDFADRKNIKLIRVTGEIITVNYWKVLDHPQIDPPVYPGDKIEVPRRIW